MKPADLATVQRLFEVVAPTAAAEMKARVLAVVRDEYMLANLDAIDSIRRIIAAIEMLPLSKEP